MMTLANLFAALTLVIAALVLAPAVDAATCAPDAAIAHQTLTTEHAQDGSKDSHDRMGGEIHGHCHHPGERPSSGDFSIAKPQAQASRYILRDDSTVSFASDGLKRPPRS